jgi:hypothetical protein
MFFAACRASRVHPSGERDIDEPSTLPTLDHKPVRVGQVPIFV